MDLPAITRGLAEMRRLGIVAVPFDGPQIEPRGLVGGESGVHAVIVCDSEHSVKPHTLGEAQVVDMCGTEQTEGGQS